MKTPATQHRTTEYSPAPQPNRHFQAGRIDSANRKFRPASRAERMASWNQRMQSLFTRQTY